MFKYLILATNSEIREWIVEKKTVSGLRLAELQETFRDFMTKLQEVDPVY